MLLIDFFCSETKRLMKATFAYDPQNSDELELKVDDIVEIIKEVSLLLF